MNGRNELAARCMEDLHTYTREGECCVVTGPLCDHPRRICIGGCYDASEQAARKLIRELAALDVRPVVPANDYERIQAAIRRATC